MASIHTSDASEQRGILVHLRAFESKFNTVLSRDSDQVPGSPERPRFPQSEQSELFNSSTGSTVCKCVCVSAHDWTISPLYLIHSFHTEMLKRHFEGGSLSCLSCWKTLLAAVPQVFFKIVPYVLYIYLHRLTHLCIPNSCVPRCKHSGTPGSLGIRCLQRQI